MKRASLSLGLLGGAMALMLGGCQPDLKMGPRQGAVPSRDMQSCAASGGTIQVRGRMQRPTCVHPYSDAGKSCSDKADCQGRCIVLPGEKELPEAGAQVIGRCQADNKLFGCYAEVEGGKAKAAICVD